jgi:hypothetical protein
MWKTYPIGPPGAVPVPVPPQLRLQLPPRHRRYPPVLYVVWGRRPTPREPGPVPPPCGVLHGVERRFNVLGEDLRPRLREKRSKSFPEILVIVSVYPV